MQQPQWGSHGLVSAAGVAALVEQIAWLDDLARLPEGAEAGVVVPIAVRREVERVVQMHRRAQHRSQQLDPVVGAEG